MDVGEFCRRDWNWSRWDVDMVEDFGLLAGDAGAAPGGNVTGKVGPYVTGRNQATCGADAGVG